MGFFDDLCSAVTSFGKGVKEAATSACKTVKETYKEAKTYIQKKMVDFAKSIEKKYDKPTINTTSFYTPGSSKTKSEDEKIAIKKKQNEEITKYQQKVRTKALERENQIKDVYLDIYNLDKFKGVFGQNIIDDIQKDINKKSHSFANIMRDSINTKVSPGYPGWEKLMNSTKTKNNDFQQYCDKVFDEADNDLLSHLELMIKESNLLIQKKINKYNDDRATALKTLKDSLLQLTKDEETKAAELERIAEEMTVMQYISNEVHKDL